MVWWLFHCRYKSVWVGFLNTDVLRLPSSLGVTRMSRNGIDPSSLTSSQENFMFWWMEFRCCRKLLLFSFFIIVKVSSTYLFQSDGGVSDVWMVWTSRSSMKNLLMAPKDKDPITNKSGVIYRFKCSEDECEEKYIGESARTFAERFKEHQKSPSPIHDHSNISGHKVDLNNFTIIEREDQNITKAIKEALFIRVNDPSLNRNIGKIHLPYIWDEVFHKTPELQLKH